MDTLSPGLTEIDTLYELKGFQMASAFHQKLAVVVIAILLGFGIVQALYASAEENRFRKLVVYLIQAMLVWFLLVPIDVKVNLPTDWASSGDLEDLIGAAVKSDDLRPTLKAPRFLVWSHAAIDSFQRVLIGTVNKTFAKEPFSSDRAVVLLRHAKIQEFSLRAIYHAFVGSCYVPLLAERRVLGLRAPPILYDPFKVPAADYRLDDIGSNPENGIGDQTYIFPAIAAMYLLAPGLALVVVNLLTAGAKSVTNSVGGIAPGGGGAHGPDIGSMMPSPSNGGQQGGGDSSGDAGGGGSSGAGEAAAGAAEAVIL